MESARFDRLVRTLGQPRSRRQTLRTLAGTGAALLLGLPAATTLADCQRQCQEKDNGAQRRCRERCREEKQDRDGASLRHGSGEFRDCSQVPKVPGADLSHCDLVTADLRGLDLHFANFQDADMVFSWLEGAGLYGANLTGADLFSANLIRADLTKANLTDANLTKAYLDDTIFCETIMPDGRVRLDPGDCE